MFIYRFLQVVILAYLFNLLIVACSANNHSGANTSPPSIIRFYQLFLDCNKNLVEILSKRVRAIYRQGRVANKGAYSWLEVEAVSHNSHERNVSLVRIRGNETKKYLCFNKELKLITRHSYHKSCEFREIYTAGFTKFESEVYPGFYMAFSKNGRPFKNRPSARAGSKKHKMRHSKSDKPCDLFTKVYPELVHTNPKNYNEKG